MTDTVTLDLDRVNGLDSLAYWAAYGQHFPVGSPYRDLPALVAHWAGSHPDHLTSADRTLVAWLTFRQAGNADAPLPEFAVVLPVLPPQTDEAPSGADVDAPGDG